MSELDLWSAIKVEHEQRTAHHIDRTEHDSLIMPMNGCDVCYHLRSWVHDFEEQYYAGMAQAELIKESEPK
jgi:hypothetical protein